MALTPYEFGKETGRLHGQLDCTVIDEERAKKLAQDLRIEEETEFLEGYRNGFTEEKQRRQLVQEGTDAWLASADHIPNPSWGLTEDEIAEAEREMIVLDESLEDGKEVDNSNLHCIICGKKPPEVKLFRAAGYGYQICEEHSKGYSQLVEIEEGQKAYQQMASDETRALKAEITHGAYYL